MLFSLLVFCAATLAVIAVYLLVSQDRSALRLRELTGQQTAEGWTATFVKLAGPFARLSTPEGGWEDSAIRRRFLNAGIRRIDAPIFYFAAKTLLPIFFGVLTYLILIKARADLSGLNTLLFVVIAATAGCYLPNVALALAVRSRKREIFENFPDAADLLLVCVEAGLGLDAALLRVADEMRLKSLAVAEELHLTNLEIRAGGTREQALRNLGLRTSVEEIGTFATMLSQADRFGTSIGDSLRVFSDDLRHKRQARAEELAAKVPTKMLFPLVAFVFPAVVMVILGPAVIQIVRTVMPSISGSGS